jgi:tRNA(adenine34) deaminase
MCAGAIFNARIKRLVYGASDSKAGACGSLFNIVQNKYLNHRAEVTAGVMEAECGQVLKEFLNGKR